MKKVTDPDSAVQKSTDPTGSGSSSLEKNVDSRKICSLEVNLFFRQGSVNLDEISDLNERYGLEVQISEFGQGGTLLI